MDKSPLQWMLEPLRRYADFRGRARRAEFWWWMLGYFAVAIGLMLVMFSGFPWQLMTGDTIDQAALDPEPFAGMGVGFWLGGVLYLVFALGTIVPNLAVTVRRLHDRGMSGWWYAGVLILNFVPVLNILSFFGFIGILVICALPGEDGPNKWGPDPKDPAQASVFA